jgi:thiamine biosynthesis protein ThiS
MPSGQTKESEMNVKVNGASQSVQSGLSVRGLLEMWGKEPAHVAVEHNGRILERDEFATTVLLPEDCLEVVHFVGGG